LSKDTICTWVLFMVSFLLLPSCVATKQDVLALNRQIHTLHKELNKITSVREKQAETGAEMDSVRMELQRVSGGMEENRRLIKHVIERDPAEGEALNTRLAELEKKVSQLYKYLNLETLPKTGKPGVMVPKKPSGVAPPPVPSAIQEETVSPENQLYERTLAVYHGEEYKEAVAGFKTFLKTYPKSKLADNAQFWIGESYMSQKKYDQAIVAFQDVIEKYPNGNKVPNAMLKQALAFYEIKDSISSRAILKRIIKKYPNSSEAKIAEAKLSTIK